MTIENSAIASIEREAVSAAAAERILKRMKFTVDRIVKVDPGEEKATVLFISKGKPYRMGIELASFLRDFFGSRWRRSFDYELYSQPDTDLVLATQGERAPNYWIKTHAAGHYECDCNDWIRQYSRRGLAVCKHTICLGRLNECSISDMLNAQAIAPRIEAA